MRSRRLIFSLAALLLSLTGLTAAFGQVEQVYVTTQRFERGLMVWRADNSTIYVLGGDGLAASYPASAYNTLPDNPVARVPAEYVRPIFGFGKLWGNNMQIRNRLGYAVLPEIGFTTSIQVINATVLITELDGSTLQILPDGTWQRAGVFAAAPLPCLYPLFFGEPSDDVCPSQPQVSSAAFQRFERGFMIWLAQDGDVWVFLDSSPALGGTGRWLHFAESTYAAVVDPSPVQPPPHRLQPQGAFGRVWSSLRGWADSLRSELGWALTPEASYLATQQVMGRTSHVHTYLSLPNNRVLDAYSGLAGLNWTWVR